MRYFWDGNRVLEREGIAVSERPLQKLFRNMHCFRVNQFRKGYGKYTARGWINLSPDEVSPTFRTHLLLLGVS